MSTNDTSSGRHCLDSDDTRQSTTSHPSAAPSSMPPRVIAIGDVHGCAAALRALVSEIRPQPDDTLVILGDCVDRGPDSRGTVDEVLRLRDKCQLVPLMGNHEEMMLNYLDGKPQPDNWLEVGGAATLRSYATSDGQIEVSPEHVDFIRAWGDFHEMDTHFFVHGSYDPELPLPLQRWNVFRWHSLRDGLPGAHESGRTAVVGHTSQKSGEVLDVGYLKCIDTYCWGGGWLTALDVTTGQLWQCDRDGRPRDGNFVVDRQKSC
jgi:serine/threonine protein phosphatase 1